MYGLAVILGTFLLGLSSVTAAAAPADRTVGNGDLFVVEAPSGAGDAVWAELEGRRFPAIRSGTGGKSFFLLGFDLDTDAGIYPLRVHFEGRPESVETLEISVHLREFAVEKLSLPEKMVTPPADVLARIGEERKAAATVYASSAPDAMWLPPFNRPVEGEPSGNFGKRRILNGKPKSPHSGEDYKAGLGSEVKAVARGRVGMARDLYYSGKTILLDHGGGLVSQYFHLDRMSVEEGQVVQGGEIIGNVGATGRVTGPHLHFGVRLHGMRSDPSLLWRLFSD
jgi:murein DD-endopeptidase MepM/ murein hydrolase activator NlpD